MCVNEEAINDIFAYPIFIFVRHYVCETKEIQFEEKIKVGYNYFNEFADMQLSSQLLRL